MPIFASIINPYNFPDGLKHILTPITIFLALIIAGCSEDENFTVEGHIDGTAAQSITLTYFADGGLKTITQSAKSGVFSFKGVSKTPTMAVVTVAPENLRIATLVVSNGDRISIEADLADPMKTKINGNSDSEKIAKWIVNNSETLRRGHAAEINKIVADYVASNKKSPAAAAIMSTYFMADGYASRADSLLQLLERNMRSTEMMQGFATVVTAFRGAETTDPVPFMALYSTNDSLIRINPIRHKATLLCILDDDRRARDSVVAHLHRLTDSVPFERLAAVEISTAPDSASWRASLGSDSVAWPQTWIQGSVAASPIRKLAVHRIPYFIATDSAGKPIYRGPSISAAARAIESRLK